MKRTVLRLLSLALLFSIVLPLPTITMASGNFISDEANLLSEGEIASFNEKAAEIYASDGIAVFVMTVETLDGGDIVDRADLVLESTGVDEGILLFLSMEERDYAISTFGNAAIGYFDDDRLYQMEELVIPYLSSGNYCEAFDTFVTFAGEVIREGIIYEDDEDYDIVDMDDEYEFITPAPSVFSVKRLVVCLVFGLLLAGIPIGRYKSALRNVRMKTDAADYVRSGSMVVTSANDIFLYRHVNAIPRNTDNKGPHHTGGPGSHGGGSTHHSSSGMTHGGTHGKF